LFVWEEGKCEYKVYNVLQEEYYSHKPVVKVTLDIGELYKLPTKDLGDFNERLLALFPGLKKHYCSLGYEGGFEERLKEGTYIGHVTEHLIIELQNILDMKLIMAKHGLLRNRHCTL